MKFIFQTITVSFILVLYFSCNKKIKTTFPESDQCSIIINMIEAVNEKNAEKYILGFDEKVKAYVESELKVDGLSALKENRANHFKKYPFARSEIQHLVEIDNKVIMHDKVWLKKSDKEGKDIVEIFTFEKGKVIRFMLYNLKIYLTEQ